MGDLRIYDTQGRLLEPAVDGNVTAEGRLGDHIDNSADLYVEPDSRRVTAYVRAKTSVVSGDRTAHYHAHYVADEGEDPIEGLLDRLRALQNAESTYGDHEWEFLRDRDRFCLIWWIGEIDAPSLLDAGLDQLGRIAVEHLLRDGHDLSFGVNGYRAAAIAAAYFARESGLTLSIGVSSGGRIRPIQAADLVLAPGEYDGMEPLPDGSRETVESHEQHLAENATQLYESRAMDALDRVAKTDELSVLQRYRDLSSLETFLSSLWSTEPAEVDLRSDQADHVVEITRVLRRGGSVNDLPDPATLLDEPTRKEVCDRVLQRVRDERGTLESEMPERVRSEFTAALEALLSHEVTAVNESLTQLLDLFDGHRTDLAEPLPDPAHRMAMRIHELDDNEALTARQRNEIREEFEAEVADTRATLKERKREKFLERFDRCLDRLDLADIRGDGDVVAAIRRVVNDPESATTDSELVSRFASVVADVESSPIISGQDRRELTAELKDRLDGRLDTLRSEREESIRTQLETEVDELEQRSDGEDLSEVYDRLWRAKQLCSQVPNSEYERPKVHRFAGLVRELNQDELVPQDRADEIRSEINARLGEELDRIERTRREEIRTQLDDELDRLVPQLVEDPGHERAIELFEDLRRYVEGKTARIPDPRFETLCDLVASVRDDPKEVDGILDPPAQRELRSKITTAIEDAQTRIREDHKEEFVESFEDTISSVLNYPGLSTRTRLELIDRLQSYIEQTPGTVPAQLSKLDVDVDSTHRKNIAELYDHATNDIHHSRTVDQDTILTLDQLRDLRKNHYAETLDDAIETAREEFEDDVVERLSGKIRAEITELDQYRTDGVEAVEEDLKFLEAVRTELREAGTRTGDVPEHISKGIDGFLRTSLLTDDRIRAVCEELERHVEKLINERRKRKTELQVGAFDEELTRISELELDPGERLLALRQLELLLEQGKTDPNIGTGYLSDVGSLRAKRAGLDAETVSELTKEIDEVRGTVADQYRTRVVDEVTQQLEAFIENSQKGAKVGLEYFTQYLSGSSFDPKKKHIKSAKDTFDDAKDLNRLSALPDADYEQLKKDIHQELQRLSTGPTSLRGRVLNKIPRSKGDVSRRAVTAFKRNRRISVVALLLLGVLVGVAGVVAAGVVGIGPGAGSGDGTAAGAPAVELTSPGWGETVDDDEVLVEATVEADRYTLSLVNDEGDVVETTGRTDADGTISDSLPVGDSGTYYVVLTASNEEATTEMRRIEVESDPGPESE